MSGGRLSSAFAFLVACSPIPAAAADWPQWGGHDFGRNMVSDVKGLPESFDPGKKDTMGGGVIPGTARNVRWSVRLGSHIYGNPTVADGRVFVGTDDVTLRGDPRLKATGAGMVFCLDEATGKRIWRMVTPKRSNARLPKGAHYGQQHMGTCSSPTVDGDRVYVLTTADELVCLDVDGLADGNDGPFKDEGQYMVGPGKDPVKLEPDDADILWVFDIVEEVGACPHDVASCSPLVHGPFIYFSTSNGVDGSHEKMPRPDAPSLVVLDKMTGRLVAYDEEKIGHRIFHCLWSPPSLGVVNGKTLVFFGGGEGICYAFEAPAGEGEKAVPLKKVWSYDCNPPEYRLKDGKPIRYTRGDKRKKASPNNNDGTYVGPSEIISTPVFHDGRVYVTIGQDPAHGRGRGMMYCIDPAQTGDVTGKACIWKYEAIERSMSSVAIADGLIYTADLSGRVHCLALDTGKVVWTHDLKAETWATPLVADGKVFVGTKKYFYVLAAGREPKRLAQIRLGSASYGTPVAVNGTLFVSSLKDMWAVQAGAETK